MNYLQASGNLQVAVDLATNAIELKARDQHLHTPARFDIHVDYKPIVTEAENLYRKMMSLITVSGSDAHAALLSGSFSTGEKFDTIIFPLANRENAKIVVWMENGSQEEVRWHWKEPILVMKHTCFRVELNKRVGAIVVMFPRILQTK
ncbi:hypothetical protein LOZ58_006851 [Ophidiomyces ophidiicola]|nr:hypothetical protein LOZ65_006887 [Ophidiomyces ophidiicola]KAI1955100.1 hypothetical protein LOZ58_006851 [Ophidiomyces ophidiicola]